MGAFVEEIACVEIEVAPPVFVRLAEVERALEIQPEFVIERFPKTRIARTVKLGVWPSEVVRQIRTAY
jgi:hypothetical protein